MPLTAADIMTKDVKTVRPDNTIAQIAKLLSDSGISAAPVQDRDGRLLGMVSEGDLLRPVGQELAEKRAWWLNILADGTDLSPAFLESIRVGNRLARDLMVTPVVTATPETSVPVLADMLVRHHVKRLPIVGDGKLVGIVSRADLVRALALNPDAITDAI